MKSNVGTTERVMRALAGLAMLAFGILVPLPLPVRVGLLGASGGLLLTALAGRCLAYRLLGRSSCRLDASRTGP